MADKEAYQATMRDAASAAWDHDWDTAARLYRRAIELMPNDSQALAGLGLSLMEAGDNSGAEAQLQRVAGSGDKNLASLARMALAALYRQTGRDPQAIQIYKELVEKPTDTVAKPAAQLELASLYATKDSGEARKLYEQVRLDNPNSAAASIATSKLAELK